MKSAFKRIYEDSEITRLHINSPVAKNLEDWYVIQTQRFNDEYFFVEYYENYRNYKKKIEDVDLDNNLQILKEETLKEFNNQLRNMSESIREASENIRDATSSEFVKNSEED